MRDEVLVIGAGPGGLAVAATLGQRGVPALVLERSSRVGESWRQHYDRLHLHTVRWLSNLPGYRFSSGHGRWVSRDGVVRYLEGYARHHRLQIRHGVEVRRLERAAGGWRLVTAGEPLEARDVVVATGYNREPRLPDWPGSDGFAGELLHASRYRNAEPYRGRDVLVVGSGNTGAEIAVDLAESGAGRVRIAIRTPPNILLREVNGVPGQAVGVVLRHAPLPVADAIIAFTQRLAIGDLSPYGLPRAPRGAYTQFMRDDVVPILDVGLIDAVKRGSVEVVPGVQGFDGADVVLAGGERIQPDAVIAATGYRRALEPLVGHLGLLDGRGRPVVHGPQTHPDAPGLRFIGFTNPPSGNLRELAIDARRIARAVARERRSGAVGAAA